MVLGWIVEKMAGSKTGWKDLRRKMIININYGEQ